MRVARAPSLFCLAGTVQAGLLPGTPWAATKLMAPQGCSEWEAFRAVARWAAGGAALDEVERLLSLVRYPLMSCREVEVRRERAHGTAQDGHDILHAALCQGG